jgi:hypothetical protein
VEISSFTSGTSRAKGCNTVPLAVLFAMFWVYSTAQFIYCRIGG